MRRQFAGRPGYKLRRTIGAKGKLTRRWFRDWNAHPFRGFAQAPAQTRQQSDPTDLVVSPPTTAELHAALVSAKAAATVLVENSLDTPSIDDLAHEHLMRLAAQQLLQARRAQLLLEARGITDLAHLYSCNSFNEAAERFGLDTALARIKDPRAFEHVADKTLRRELVEDAWRMPAVDVRRDPATGEVRLYPEEPTPPHLLVVELHLEALHMFPDNASSRLAWVRVQREAAGL